MKKYIYVSIYRSQGSDCTNNGVTAANEPAGNSNTFVVEAPRGNVSEETVAEMGYIVLEAMPPAFNGCPVRFKERNKEGWPMAGGNFAYTSDGRFSEAYGMSPVSVHDRYEG